MLIRRVCVCCDRVSGEAEDVKANGLAAGANRVGTTDAEMKQMDEDAKVHIMPIINLHIPYTLITRIHR